MMNDDSDSFCEMVRREGIMLHDIECNTLGNYERVTYYYHSGYICNVTMLNGDFDSWEIASYPVLKYMHNLIDNNFKKACTNLKTMYNELTEAN